MKWCQLQVRSLYLKTPCWSQFYFLYWFVKSTSLGRTPCLTCHPALGSFKPEWSLASLWNLRRSPQWWTSRYRIRDAARTLCLSGRFCSLTSQPVRPHAPSPAVVLAGVCPVPSLPPCMNPRLSEGPAEAPTLTWPFPAAAARHHSITCPRGVGGLWAAGLLMLRVPTIPSHGN